MSLWLSLIAREGMLQMKKGRSPATPALFIEAKGF